MRQAIVIKNPKWEPFVAASDAFKKVKDNETAVLVVRGRCKEHKVAKVSLIKKAAALVIGLCLLGFTASAQQNLLSALPTATIASATTNWGRGGLIGVNMDQSAVFQLTSSATNASAIGVISVRIDNSDNGTDWLTNQIIIAATNGQTAIVRATNNIGGKWWRIGGVSNTGSGTTNDSTITRFSVSLKER